MSPGVVVNWVQRWWRQVDHYDWFVAYLEVQSLIGPVRVLVAAITLTSGLSPVLLMTTPEGARDFLGRLVAGAAAIGLVLLGLMWAVCTPTRRQSTIFATGTAACIAAAALSCRDPETAVLFCTAFSVVAGYVAFAHTAIYAIYTFNLALVVATVEAARLGMSGRWPLGLTALWLVAVLTLSVPAGIQIIVHSLGIDLLRADSDPLTLTLNRRAFIVKARELISRRHATNAYLSVMMIDLDGFKFLNDTLGHSAGDRALIAVADILRTQTRDTAVIGRNGGDEFLIADVADLPRQTMEAERLRHAIADMPDPITASIGLAMVELDRFTASTIGSVIDTLVAAADHQMYTAKRAGGNQLRHVALGPSMRG